MTKTSSSQSLLLAGSGVKESVKCGKSATQLCAQCIFEDEGWLCDECGEEMLLPVVNSPPVGMCGYTG